MKKSKHLAQENSISTIPVEIGKTYPITIERLGKNAEGIGKIEDFTIFVPLLLPQEEALIKITLVKKNYAVGKVEKLIKKASTRVETLCPIYQECGGCQMQHLAYEAQLIFKREAVRDALFHIGKLAIPVHETIGADDPWHYRNKMQFPVMQNGDEYQVGCFSSKTHTVIDTTSCLIQEAGNNEILSACKKALQALHLPAYDEKTHSGIIRHLVGRVTRDKKMMLALVTKSKDLPHKDKIIEILRKNLPHLTSLYQNIQSAKTNVILGRENKLLYGKETIEEVIGTLKFNISLHSFFQVNTQQAGKLYQKALELADLKGDEIVIDAYSGTGTIALFLAQKAKKVYGIEIVPSAVENAWQNASTNHMSNVEFILGDTADIMPKLYKKGIHPHLIILDPPRKGVDKKVLLAAKDMHPKKIIYISCNPSTLARDLSILKDVGYLAQAVFPLDMFPMTRHVECIALIQRVKS